MGSGVITLKKALLLSAVFDFLGAIVFGRFVSATLMKGIVDVTNLPAEAIIKGMIAALLATGLWVLLASILKIPMSISQAIVGGVMGFGLVTGGAGIVNWVTVSAIFTSWFILPLFSAALAATLYFIYRRMFRRLELINIVASSSTFLMVFSTVFLLMVKTLKLEDLAWVLIISTLSGSIAALAAHLYWLRLSGSLEERASSVMKLLIIVAAAAMAFSHGANDVANSAGPLSAIYVAYREGYVPAKVKIDPLILSFCAAGIAVGIVSWGQRVVDTIGQEITLLNPQRAFVSQLAGSLSVLVLTRLGMPVSTTMSIVGAVAGVGLARGLKAVNVRTLAKIFGAWALAVPAVMGMTAGLYYLFIALPL